jgi:pyrimidine-nucleoside phosphorylase
MAPFDSFFILVSSVEDSFWGDRTGMPRRASEVSFQGLTPMIRKKRMGGELSRDEIAFLIRGYSKGEIPDYQVSAFLMAVVFRGMTDQEMAAMTEEMRESGSVIDLGDLPGRKVDKHSTGGVGDKTSLVIAPVVAAAGIIVPMISGRGLAHTGGTLDKLEAIPGFNVRLSPDRFKKILACVGACLIGQTEDLVPADRKLYALRDVTGTVDSHPLIATSIMSKKLAEGIDALVLDVKTGSGAFMKRSEDAETLARAMVAIGKSCGKRMAALMTDMNQPLGEYAGNSLEVLECLEVLKGRGTEDLVALCQELSAYCLWFGEAVPDVDHGRKLFRELIDSGRALDKFREMVRSQDGDASVVDDYSALPQARFESSVPSPEKGYLQSMDTEMIGLAIGVLGAGRETIDSPIDHAVGVRFHKKIGDPLKTGEALCTVYYNDEARHAEARRRLLASYRFSPAPVERPELVKKVIS